MATSAPTTHSTTTTATWSITRSYSFVTTTSTTLFCSGHSGRRTNISPAETLDTC